MRIAAYNVENLFARARVFDEDAATSARLLDALADLSALFEKPAYDPADKARMLALMDELGILRSDEARFVTLRRLRGRLIKRTGAGAPMILAEGRDDWVGWAEPTRGPVRETAMMNTARTVLGLQADILAIVEAEDRPSLVAFQDILLPDLIREDGLSLADDIRYDHIMLIDGNDGRGIDVGLGTRANLPIRTIRSHVNDRDADGNTIFSRDCPEYEVILPSGDSLWVLPNHFKSKFGGNDARSRARRQAQAARVAEIYRDLRAQGFDKVVVLGDLNDTPDSAELAPLLAGTDLRDASDHPAFTAFEFDASTGDRGIGTYDTGRDSLKIDYLLLSPALFERMTLGGIFRKGAWTASGRWEMFPTLKGEKDAASDHHAIWADLDL